jgi:hypothetical protein
MSTPTVLPFPRFAAGFPLRASDLTNLFSYFEGDGHHTRTCLLGVGVFYGLKVSISGDGSRVHISAGAGVTSQGYLYCQDKEVEFGNYTTIKVSHNDFTNTKTTVGLAESAETTSDTLFDVLELNDAGVGGGLTPSDLNNKTLVILFDIESNRLNGCTTCNNGFASNIIVRRLLVPADKMPPLMGACAIPSPAAARTNGFPYLGRFGFSKDGCANDFSAKTLEAFAKNYSNVLSPGLETLKNRLSSDLIAYASSLGIETAGTAAETPLDFWNGDFLKQANPYLLQYLHDYLRHVIRAYTELAETPFGRDFQIGLPDEACFPKYLMLGLLNQTESNVAVQYDHARHPLYRPPLADLNDNDFESARAAFHRLVALLTEGNLLFAKDELFRSKDRQDIQITPSRTAGHRLASRAIPFYFRGDSIRPFWDAVRSATNRTGSIPAYDRSTEVAPFDEPLLYQNAFDEADFYRIEGHVGKRIEEVITELGFPDNIPAESTQKRTKKRSGRLPLRTCLNLPFRIVVVALDASKLEGILSLNDFARQNPGLEHQGGVPGGGTFVLVIDEVRPGLQTPSEIQDVTQVKDEAGIPVSGEVSETKTVFEVVADFCLPYFYYEMKPPPPEPIAVFEESTREPLYNVITEATRITRQFTGYRISFTNRSENAQQYGWEVFAQGNTTTGTNLPVDPTEPSELPHFSQVFDINDWDERTFIVRLTATATETGIFDVTEREVVIKRLDNVIEEIPTPEEPILLREKQAPKPASPVAKASGPVSPLVVLRRLDERRTKFKKAIDDEGAAHATLPKTAVFRNIQSFLQSFDDKVDKFDKGAVTKAFQGLGDFDKQFKTNALQLLKEAKKANTLPEEVYGRILQNLSFFYLDKLAHLLTEDMLDTETPLLSIGEVFAKIKTDDPDTNLKEWRNTWDPARITAEQNELVIARLMTMFEQ